MDPVTTGTNVQDSLAMADPLAVLVLLGAVAAAASLSANESGRPSTIPARPDEPPRADDASCPGADDASCRKADDVVRAWLDSLAAPSLKR